MKTGHSTLGLLVGSNPVHLKYFDSINAHNFNISKHINKNKNFLSKGIDLISSSFSIPTDYDIVLSESCYYYPSFKKKFGFLKSKIINMNTSSVLYYLYSRRFKGLMGHMLKDLLNYTDGFLVQGKYGLETLKRVEVSKPSRIFYPFISKSRYNTLKKIKTNLDSYTITTIATGDYYTKGLDLLIHAFDGVVSDFPKAKLHIVGDVSLPRNIYPSKKTAKSIVLHSWTEDLSQILKSTSLYVHPARGETFGVSVLEAMLCGIPSIVSNETGAKEVVEKTNKNFIVPLDSNSLSKEIIKYFEMSDSKKRSLSKKSRNLASYFKEQDMIKLFKKQFYSLADEIF